MKLIDVDWLKQRINSAFWSEIGKIIDSAPSIDIVRCGECKYWNTKDCREWVGECEWAYYMTKPDDFCSYGERKEQ